MPRQPSTEDLFWVAKHSPWWPQEGPQRAGFDSEADLLLYGGAAGGGKTALMVGLACTKHRNTLIVRRESTQLGGIIDYMTEVFKNDTSGLNRTEKVWRLPKWDAADRQVVFGSTPNPGDETKYQGRPKDLLGIDEAANMLESQVAFLMGWVRSTHPGQKCRTILCSNPPTDAEGFWLVEWFAPWLDPSHPDFPEEPGKLRWYAMLDGKRVDWPNGEPFDHNGEWTIPESRTFIPAKLQDNAYLRDTGYLARLQALPEPLRSQMLYGDFTAGREDGDYQVIPSAWVKAAQARWQDREYDSTRITGCGVDPSRGGRDQTVVALREGWHYHPLRKFPGQDMQTGNDVAAKVLELVAQSHCPIHVDVIGIGASVVDALTMYVHRRVMPCNASEKGEGHDNSGTLKFANKRAELWWTFRDMLDPSYGSKIALPPDQQLYAELCSPRYKLTPSGIQVERKDDIIRRLGRSTDSADAVIMAGQRGAPMMIEGYSRVRVTGGINQ
jgi:Terminase large subunit, T4likevirus-type, N-terminal